MKYPSATDGRLADYIHKRKEPAMPESEAERIKRLRDKQIATRDPLIKERNFQRNMSVKEKRMRKPLSFGEDWRNLALVIKVPLFMLLLGIIGTILLVRLWAWEYAVYVGIGVTFGLAIFGAVLGNALDLREDIKKHLK
jgi:hypothetical protein